MSLRSNNIFEAVPEQELQELYSQIYANPISMVGRCQDGSVIVFRPGQRNDAFSVFKGVFRTDSKVDGPLDATFSFVIKDSKYLFKAQLNKKDHRCGDLSLLTTIYEIQRRSVKRLRIPNDYYAVIRLSHQNARLIRIFGKLMDISPRGIGVLLPKDELKIKPQDKLRVVLNVSQRPPENLELRVVHVRPMIREDSKTGEKSEGLFFGAVFLPEYSVTISRRMNAVVMDIYRDLFGSLSDSKK